MGLCSGKEEIEKRINAVRLVQDRQEAAEKRQQRARGMCAHCNEQAVARVPDPGAERVCSLHAERFWQTLVKTASDLLDMREEQEAVVELVGDEYLLRSPEEGSPLVLFSVEELQ
jgi:hypothetical protein